MLAPSTLTRRDATRPARQRLGDAERESFAQQPRGDRVLHRRVVRAEDDVTEPVTAGSTGPSQLLVIEADDRGCGTRRCADGETDLETLDPRCEERDRRVGAVERVEAAVERLSQRRLARAPRAKDPRSDDAGLPFRRKPGSKVRQQPALEHVLELVRHAGDRVDHLVSERADEAAAPCRAAARSRIAPTGTSAWRSVVVGHPAAPGAEHLRDAQHDRLVADRGPHP